MPDPVPDVLPVIAPARPNAWIRFWAVACLALTGPRPVAGEEKEALPSPAARASHREWRSDEEISRLFRELEPPPRTTPDAVDPDGEIVELEPYTVEGERLLILASIKYELEHGPESVRRRVAEMAPVLNQRAEMSARAAGRFFTGPPPGSPADRAPMLYVTNSQLIDAGRGIAEILDRLFRRDGRD